MVFSCHKKEDYPYSSFITSNELLTSSDWLAAYRHQV